MTKVSPDRTPDGRFHNPWPDSEPRELRDMLQWMRQRRYQPRVATPPRGFFPMMPAKVSHPHAKKSDCTATWIGHSTVLLQWGGLNLLTDPVFSPRASPLRWLGPRRVMDPGLAIDALPPLDVVVISHNHYDHLDKRSVKRIARAHRQATWLAPLGLGGLLRRWGVREVVELDWWQQATVKQLRVTATPARHFSARGLRDRNRSLWCGFAFELGDERAYFAGDTAYHPDFSEIAEQCGPFDVVMIPIGAYDPRWFMHVVHVDPEEAVRIYQDLVAPFPRRPYPVMLALHWGTFRLTDEPMDEPPRRAIARWRAQGLDEEWLWIAAFGESRSVTP